MKNSKSRLHLGLGLLLIASATLNANLLWPDVRYRMIVENSGDDRVPGTLRGIETRLHRAVLSGDADRVAGVIAEGVGPNQSAEWCGVLTDWCYTPALHLAVERGDIAMMEQLVSLGADMNARQWPSGDSVLHLAVRYRQALAVDWLLKRMNPDGRNSHGWTALHKATTGSDAPWYIRTLLKAGAAPSIRNCAGETPFETAISFNRPEGAIALLRDPRVAASVDPEKLLASVESRKYTEKLSEALRRWFEQRQEEQGAAPPAEMPPESAEE